MSDLWGTVNALRQEVREQGERIAALETDAKNTADLLVDVAQIFAAQTMFNQSVRDALNTPFGLPESLADIVKLRPGDLDPRD